MASESDSETNDQSPIDDPIPPGWAPFLLGHRFFWLHPSHAEYPREWQQKLADEARTKLDQDEHVKVSVLRLRALWERLRQEIADTSIDDQRWAVRAIPRLQTMQRGLTAEARAIGHPEVHHSMRRVYLAERVDPTLLSLIPPASPVQILVNAEDT